MTLKKCRNPVINFLTKMVLSFSILLQCFIVKFVGQVKKVGATHSIIASMNSGP